MSKQRIQNVFVSVCLRAICWSGRQRARQHVEDDYGTSLGARATVPESKSLLSLHRLHLDRIYTSYIIAYNVHGSISMPACFGPVNMMDTYPCCKK